MEQTFKNYIVKDGIATPENPFTKHKESQHVPFGQKFNFVNNSEYEAFEQWKQSHTYATNAPDGVYPKECFGEPVWQVIEKNEWREVICKEAIPIAMKSDKIRLFIPYLRKQPEPTPDKQAVETAIGNPDIIKLNEAADKWAGQFTGYAKGDIRFAFKRGSEWQSTQSYSREEVEGIMEEVLALVSERFEHNFEKRTILTTPFKDLLTK